MKSQFICVSPKTLEAKECFIHDMHNLHSCKVLNRQNGMVKLQSISGKFFFWMNEIDEDKNWKIIK
jgi:hypothetical protein